MAGRLAEDLIEREKLPLCMCLIRENFMLAHYRRNLIMMDRAPASPIGLLPLSESMIRFDGRWQKAEHISHRNVNAKVLQFITYELTLSKSKSPSFLIA